MCIPACFTWHIFALHGLESWNHILYGTCLNMSDVRLSVCCRRSIIECVCLSFFSVFHRFSEDIVLSPELLCLLLAFNEVHIGVNFVVHDYLSLFYIVREHPNMHLKFDSYEASLWLTPLQFSVYGIFTKKAHIPVIRNACLIRLYHLLQCT